MKIPTRFIRATAVCGVLVFTACGSSSATILVQKKPDEAKALVRKSMERFGPVAETPENEGYLYAYETGFMNPYKAKLFVGTHLGGEGSSSLVRVESGRADTRVLTDILSQDFGLKNTTYVKTYQPKNLALNHTLNFISPGFAYFYGGLDSPRRDSWDGVLYGSTFLVTDFLLYIFSSKAFFFNDHNSFSSKALEENWPVILATMGGFRLLMAYRSHLFVTGHNKAVTIGYKFRL